MILKEYQKRTLATVRDYLERLDEWRGKAAPLLELDPDYDWVQRAWSKTVPGRTYIPRRNGLREPLPAFCLKIPTGGGKTLLAVKVIDLANIHYRRRQTGLVLWIVPTTQIYNQTLRSLKDRDHFYRQQLDPGLRRSHPGVGEDQRFQPGGRAREPVRAPADAAVRQPRNQGNAADVPGQRRFRAVFPARRRHRRATAAPGGSAESRYVRCRRRSLGAPDQDIARQYAAPSQTLHRAGRGPQGVQRQRQGDA